MEDVEECLSLARMHLDFTLDNAGDFGAGVEQGNKSGGFLILSEPSIRKLQAPTPSAQPSQSWPTDEPISI